VLPGDRHSLQDIASGEHEMVAVGVSSTVARRHAFTLQPDTPYTWTLSADRGVVEVLNGSGEAIELAPVLGESGGVLAAGARLTVRDVPPGERTLRAIGHMTKMPYEETLTVRPGQQVRWHVGPISATIRVDNGTRRTLEIYVDATWHARLEGGASRVITDLAPGAHALVAVSPDGRTVYRRHIDAPALRAASWRIVADPASYRIENQRTEPLMAFIDGRGLGEVADGRGLTFTGLEAGSRLLEVVGATTGRTLRRRVVLKPDAPDRAPDTWTVDDPTASLVITNSTSETLLTEGSLAVTTSAIEAGATSTFLIPVGRAMIRLIGESSGVTHSRDFTVLLDQLLTWNIGATTGHVVFYNGLREALMVTVDGAD
ncbi:MAG: hypothetical protein QF464_22900, partial [Myxococcota bacterium]|nr:hypothetical protein [Myxococcota bacterium]